MRCSPAFHTLDNRPVLWLRLVIFAIVLICTVGVRAVWAVDTDFHYLAADPSLHAATANVNVTLGQATHVGKVLDRDQAWESPYLVDVAGSVLVDPTGQWRMYYEMRVPGQEFQRGVAMATSNNGVQWTKPVLNVTGSTYTTDPKNNFVNLPQTWMAGPNVFVDPNAPASQRYRMSATVNETTLHALTSADGVNWTSSGLIDDRGGNAALDSLNVTLWDSNTQKYTEFGRWWYGGGYGGRRGVYMKQSDTWDGTAGTWTGSRQFILDPASLIPPGSTNYFDIYTPGVQTYHGQYIALPAIYHHPGSWSNSGAIYPSLMYSRDGVEWSMPDAYHSMIDLSAHDRVESDANQASYTATSMVEHDGQLYIYYAYYPNNHNSGVESSGEIHLATLPVDRFVGIQSTPGSVGEWTTSAITLSSDPGHLMLNALVEGSVRVEVLDASNMTPIAGFNLTDATPLGSGDYLDAVARWDGVDRLNSLAGRTVALRFTLDDATIYGFHFQPAPEPSTIVLAITGLIGLLAYAWRKRR
jgi:hypothetical protein